MRDQLRALSELQKFDIKILELARARDAFPARLREVGEKVAKLKAAFTAEQEKAKELLRARKMREGDVAAEVEKIKKWEAPLHEIKTNREYQALLREIDIARKANSDVETEIIDMISQTEAAEARVKALEAEVAQAQAEYANEERETATKVAEFDAKIEGIRGDRDASAAVVEVSWLRKYDALRVKRGGIAVAQCKDGTCMACRMRLPPQLYHQILAGHSLEFCPSCHRMLFVDDAAAAAESAASSAAS